MATKKLFPSRIADGAAFCNREHEREQLQQAVNEGRHTLVVSPRRYGKTSLILKALKEMGVDYAYIQFFNALDDRMIATRLNEGLSKLLNSLIPFSKKAVRKLEGIINHSKVAIKLGVGSEFDINLEPTGKNPREIIAGLFDDIKNIAALHKKPIVIFMDEFQDIESANISDEFQAIMRDFAQFNHHITLIVSGSRRHMLESMFDDRSKPFYKLFDKLYLQRIKAESYQPFIQKHAKEKWGHTLEQATIDRVLSTTEQHSYYVNKLCFKLWQYDDAPDPEKVNEAWDDVLQEEFSSLANDLALISKNQRIVLQSLSSYDFVNEPTSKTFLQATALAQGSVVQALSSLQKKDFIETTNKGIRIVDPLLKYLLSK